MCLDNDEAGLNGCLRVGIKLQDEYSIRRHSPKGKDFNEDLVAMKEEIDREPREPPDLDEGEAL